jgi:hypothetical protein
VLIVAPLNGAGLVEYHYSLIIGIFKTPYFMLLVLFAWFLYARKYTTFVSAIIRKPEYAFMHVFNQLPIFKRFLLFFFVAFSLLLPILLYAVLIITVGWQQHFKTSVILITGYLLLLCIAPAIRHISLLKDTSKNIRKRIQWIAVYPVILIRYIINQQTILWLSLKLFTCVILYCAAQNNNSFNYDAASIFIFFNFGIIAHGVLIFRTREFEEKYLSFYRGLQVSLLKRLLEYALVYFILLIPEFITAAILLPVKLHYADAVNFTIGSFMLLLLMNSITFLYRFSMKTYLKIALLIICIQFIVLMFFSLTYLLVVFLLLSIVFFISRYYTFE